MVKEVRSPDALEFERKMRDSIVESAEALNNSGVDFSTFDDSRCNPQFWTRTEIGGFQLNADVEPSVAIKDIFQNGHLYAFECATAMVIVMYRATIEAIGEQAFNKYFADLFLWDWNYNDHLRLITTHNKSEMLPGDIVYFKNSDHAPSKPEWQGENAVKLGDDLFYGHGIGITTAEIIIDSLNEERVPGSDVSAYLVDDALHPDFKYLQSLSTESGFPTVGNRGLQYTVMSRIGVRNNIFIV
jgi:protein-glutamine gamma-glutamyltransferase